MKTKYLLSSIGVHLILVAVLSPLVLSSPPKAKPTVAYVELQKVPGISSPSPAKKKLGHKKVADRMDAARPPKTFKPPYDLARKD